MNSAHRVSEKTKSPKQTVSVFLPASLNLEPCVKQFPVIKQGRGKRVEVNLNTLKWIISTVIYFQYFRDNYSPWVEISSKYMKTHVKHYRAHLDWLIALEILVENQRYSNQNGTGFCKAYALHEKYRDDEIREYRIRKRIRRKEKIKMYDPVSEYLNAWICDERLIINYNEAETVMNKLDVRKRNAWKITRACMRGRECGRRDETSYRFHSLITRWPRYLRSTVSFGGEQLASVDITNSQPYFLSLCLQKSIEEGIRNENESQQNELSKCNVLNMKRDKYYDNQYENIMLQCRMNNIRDAKYVFNIYLYNIWGDEIIMNTLYCNKKHVPLYNYIKRNIVRTLHLHSTLLPQYVATSEKEESGKEIETNTIDDSSLKWDIDGNSLLDIYRTWAYQSYISYICGNQFSFGSEKRVIGERIENGAVEPIDEEKNHTEKSTISEDITRYIDLNQKGLFYEALAESWNVSREDAKSSFMMILFGRNVYQKQEEKAFAKEYPNVYRFIKQMKREGHNQLAILLQSMESSMIIDRVCTFLMKNHPEAPVFTIHDSILTIPSYVELVRSVITQQFYQWYGTAPVLKVEPWESCPIACEDLRTDLEKRSLEGNEDHEEGRMEADIDEPHLVQAV